MLCQGNCGAAEWQVSAAERPSITSQLSLFQKTIYSSKLYAYPPHPPHTVLPGLTQLPPRVEPHQNISLLLLSVSARPFSGSWRDTYGRLVNMVSSQSVTGAALGRWTKATTGGRGGRSEAREANLPACPVAANWSRERQVTPKCHMGSDPWADWNNVPVTNPVTTPWTSHFYLLSLNFLIRSVHGAINIPGNSP